jgi:hypothetical protein
MITASIIGKGGRLGNALFQYAAARSLAIYHNVEFKLHPNILTNVHDGQECLLKYFKIPCKLLDSTDIITNIYSEDVSPPLHTDAKISVFYNQPIGTDIAWGHFDCEKFFISYKDIIKKDLTLIDEINNFAIEYLNNIRNNFLDNIEIIAIHIRRGDRTIHNESVDPEYIRYADIIKKSIEKFNYIKNKIFLVFTGGSHSNTNNEDIEWCKKHLLPIINAKVLFCENNSTIQDFAILSKCNHIIISYPSTFAWWAAYLNTNVNKKIIVPKKFIYSNMVLPEYSNYIFI